MSDPIAADGTDAEALLERFAWLSSWSGSWSIVVNPDAKELDKRVMISLHEPTRVIDRPQPPFVLRAHGSNVYVAIGKLQTWVLKRMEALEALKLKQQGQVAQGA